MNNLSKTIVKTIDTLDNNHIEQQKNSIVSNYERIIKYPKILKDKIMQKYNILNEMSNYAYRYNCLCKNGFTDDAEQEVQKLFSLVDKLNSASSRRAKVNVDTNFAMQELEKFMQKHMAKVGKIQAVKDFQLGMNLLNKKKKESIIASKRQLKEDGDFGEKTLACFCDACRNYSPRILKKHIRRGALANAIFKTKNNPRIKTDELVRAICKNLKG